MFDIKSDEGFLLLHVRRVIFFIHGFVHGRPGSIDTDWAIVVRLQGKLNHDCVRCQSDIKDNLWELFYRKNDLTGEKGNR